MEAQLELRHSDSKASLPKTRKYASVKVDNGGRQNGNLSCHQCSPKLWLRQTATAGTQAECVPRELRRESSVWGCWDVVGSLWGKTYLQVLGHWYLRRKWQTSDWIQNGLLQKGEPNSSPPLTFPFYISLYCNGFHHEETQLEGPSRSRYGGVRMTASKTVVTKPLFCISCSDPAIPISTESRWIQKGCRSMTTESGGKFSTFKISLTMVPSHENGSHENWQVCISSP